MTGFLTWWFTLIARFYLWRYEPRIVAVTGNAGKTSTRQTVAAVLAAKYRVRTASANLNTDLGVPATIVGAPMAVYEQRGGSAWFWLRAMVRAKMNALYDRNAPEVIVLEYGADRPGDIARLARRFRPEVAVVTQVGEVPVHVEFFSSPQHLAQEKSQLVRALPADGHAVLNADDLSVLDMRRATTAPVTTFGFGAGADVQASEPQMRMSGSRPVGMSFDVTAGVTTMPVLVRGSLGKGIAAAATAAIAVGRIMGVGMAEAAQALAKFTPPAGRMRILDGIKGSLIVDDTYNASPAAMHLAIDTIRHLNGRKVLVLGDMLELGTHSVQAHQAVGTMAATVADVLVCVGEAARFYETAAADQMAPDRIRRFENSRDAAAEVRKLIRPGDIVLVKGSQGIRMERIVKEIMADPEHAGGLLVRQSARWLAK
ncbi:MAG TPA: Mur ligase family protein [Candidatus Paceibacterota bacterium]|nr:Mur ligase family protein [Candidatus Paceibacterota bacterium]